MSDAVLADTVEQIAPDWELIKASYIQGLTPAELTKQFGVSIQAIRKRVVRGKWSQLQTISRHVVMHPKGKDLSAQSESVRTALAGHLEQSVAVLSKSKLPTSYKAIKEQQSALQPLVQNAKVVFGWSDQTGTNIYNIALLDSAKLISRDSSQVVDVESVTTDKPVD